MNSLFKKINLKNIGIEQLLVLALFAFSIFVRFYNVPNTVQFLGDQGRDSLVVANIFREKDLVFIGPVTSVGNMYLGPLYYYFMVPFLMLSFPSPLGPVYAVVILGCLTVFAVYFFARQTVGKHAAIFASLFIGLSATVVHGTRFSWNPNPAPLVFTLLLYFMYKALKNDVKNWIYVVVCFSILIQLHYLTLLSAAGCGLIWLYQLVTKVKNNEPIKRLLTATGVGIIIFILSLSPLILFDIKHSGLNSKALTSIVTEEESFDQESTDIKHRAIEYLIDVHARSMHIMFEIAVGKNVPLNSALVVISLATLSYIVFKDRKKRTHILELLLLVFLVTGILGTALYQHTIYDHYIAYLFPVSMLSMGVVAQYWYKKNLVFKIAVFAFIVYFLAFNYHQLQVVLKSTGWKLADIQRTSQILLSKVAQGEKYNIVLLTGTGDIDGQNYRYFMSVSDKPPVKTEHRGEVDTLLIINEDRKIDRVVDSPIYEIVVFPNKQPSEVFTIPDGPEITILRK